MSTKKCSKCGEVKNFSEFYSRKKSLDGLRCNCKSCDSVYNKNRTSNNLLIPIDLTVKFKKCSICQITLNIIYFSKNRTTKDGYSYHCKKCHREDFLKRYKENPDKFKRRTVDYRKTEIGRLNRNKHESKRRACKVNTVTEKYNPIEIFEEFGGKCFNCGTNENLTIDHIIPLIKGGHDVKYNLCVLCISCNCSKSKKSPIDFYSEDSLLLLEEIKKINIPRYNGVN